MFATLSQISTANTSRCTVATLPSLLHLPQQSVQNSKIENDFRQRLSSPNQPVGSRTQTQSDQY
eukprot:m.927309 g.927309  ORF g.927309 m.927309 type:complete len:64 (+) comp147658_c0_seq1:3-194(+)